ncbi:MAG: hypothetical protein RIE86_05145 [Imperialibacter sp.]|uniref:hypothetical protein n=1 Tax=Imperialibacter sp. TaxID=2038411 RepID=UPI0032ECC40E
MKTEQVNDYCSPEFDENFEQLINQKVIKWLPFVGKGYSDSANKVLLLGLSHYETDINDSDYPLYTRQVVVEQGIIREYTKSFFVGIEKRVIDSGKPEGDKCREIWESVSFLNLFQEPMPSPKHKANMGEMKKNWIKAIEAIKVVKPKNVILCSSSHNYINALKEVLSDNDLGLSVKEIIRYNLIGKSLPAKLIIKSNIPSWDEFNLVKLKHPSRSSEWKEWAHFLGEEHILGEFVAKFRK